MSNTATAPIAWLNTLIGAADSAIKDFCKQNLELQSLVEYYSGNLQQDIICREYPVLSADTTISSLSDGVVLPTSTINVASTKGFSPGSGGDPNAVPPAIAVQTASNTYVTITYTGVTSTSFTGCSIANGGSGTLSSSTNLNRVFTPVVYSDYNGYYGQRPGAFSDSTIAVKGSHFIVVTDRNRTRSRGVNSSNRGLLRRVGGFGSTIGEAGWSSEVTYQGKLAGHRLPYWPRGEGNLCVRYSAGFSPIPLDLQYATAQLVAYMVRVMPSGSPLSSESLGAYSYSVLSQNNDVPEIGSIQRILARYREVSF
jgi:hypothetical protein